MGVIKKAPARHTIFISVCSLDRSRLSLGGCRSTHNKRLRTGTTNLARTDPSSPSRICLLGALIPDAGLCLWKLEWNWEIFHCLWFTDYTEPGASLIVGGGPIARASACPTRDQDASPARKPTPYIWFSLTFPPCRSAPLWTPTCNFGHARLPSG